MDASEVVERLVARGVLLVVAGDRLRFRPRGAVTPELREALIEHKAEVVRLLEVEEHQVRWRAEVMRAQVPPSGQIPFLVARRSVPEEPGACLSCGEILGHGRPSILQNGSLEFPFDSRRMD